MKRSVRRKASETRRWLSRFVAMTSLLLAAAGVSMFPSSAVAQTTCTSLVGIYPDAVVVSKASSFEPTVSGTTLIGGARPVTVSVPMCRVEGVIEGNIGFELWLPARWNGRLLGAGVGGDAGVFNYGDMSRRVSEGFATVTTDSGHKIAQVRWMGDAKARQDYEHRGVHVTAIAAKRLLKTFYSKPADKAYFLGCSGGGRQGLKEMQLYPLDYDGVISGAPGLSIAMLSMRAVWAKRIQARDSAGALTAADWDLYERRVMEACDRNDGVADKLIENPLSCAFRPAALLCKPAQTNDCLSPAKVKVMQTITAPMPDEQGRPMKHDTGITPGVRLPLPGPAAALSRSVWAEGAFNTPDDDGWENRLQGANEINLADRAMPELRADNVDMDAFITRGGKAIIYTGWSDPVVAAGPLVEFYHQLAAANGGAEKLGDSVRQFMVPGMLHCGGGAGPDSFGATQATWPGDASRDIVWAMVDWVEKGKAPERLTATKIVNGTEQFTRTLCRLPNVARYDGKGDPNRSSSFTCGLEPSLSK